MITYLAGKESDRESILHEIAKEKFPPKNIEKDLERVFFQYFWDGDELNKEAAPPFEITERISRGSYEISWVEKIALTYLWKHVEAYNQLVQDIVNRGEHAAKYSATLQEYELEKSRREDAEENVRKLSRKAAQLEQKLEKVLVSKITLE